MSLPNVKANELLGRRCALVDVVDAELRALARIRQLQGALLTLAGPWPLGREALGGSDAVLAPGRPTAFEAASLLRTTYPHAEQIFARHGWQLPSAITRIYDCSAAVR